MKVAEIIQSSPPKIILWSGYGTGKTALGMTLGARCQMHDLDNGYKTGATFKDQFYEERRKVDLVQYPEPAPHQRATVFGKFKQNMFDVSTKCNQGRFEFDALLIDSLTVLADAALASVMGASGGVQKKVEIQHWGLAFNEILNILDVIRSLPIVVILNAHSDLRTIDNEDKIQLAISGKNMIERICRKFDEIWYMKVRPLGQGKYQHVIQTKSDGLITARTRHNLPDLTDANLGMWEILKLIGYTPPVRQGEPKVT